ncbi:helix-turn-helix domain-containing protein [Catenulispora subtropica]|uniref:Helix-turn-helix domain-containing protein n=1 Tax=Catenulispora subtropica TaxID=450798 RepID=A0ABN2RD98_9ACTN
MFEALGLPDPCGEVYAALVAAPHATAAELAESCGIPRPTATVALTRLVRAGMAARTPGQPPHYLASAPDAAIGTLIGRREDELRTVRSAMFALMATYRETSQRTHPALAVEVVLGREEIGRRVAQLQAAARERIYGFDRPPYVEPPGTNEALAERQMRKGITYRVIYSREAVAWPGRLENDIRYSVALGELARVRPEVPMKLLVADRRQAVIPMAAPGQAVESAYVIHPSSLLDALIALFEAEWDRALPLDTLRGAEGADSTDSTDSTGTDTPRSPAPTSTPDDTTRRLLVLLAAGLTDEGISRALGWSFRTTQRRMQALMREFGATTRFQAGVAARERGWI